MIWSLAKVLLRRLAIEVLIPALLRFLTVQIDKLFDKDKERAEKACQQFINQTDEARAEVFGTLRRRTLDA